MEQIETTDIILRCVDCGSNYILTVGEQQFFRDAKLHLPKRCPTCRARRRKQEQSGGNCYKEVRDG